MNATAEVVNSSTAKVAESIHTGFSILDKMKFFLDVEDPTVLEITGAVLILAFVTIWIWIIFRRKRGWA